MLECEEDDHYAVLGLDRSKAVRKDVLKRYKQIAKLLHPDKFQTDDDKTSAGKAFQRVNKAREVLLIRVSRRTTAR